MSKKHRDLTDDEKNAIRLRVKRGDADIFRIAQEFIASPLQVAGIKAEMHREKLDVLLASTQVRHIDGTGGLGDVPVGLANVLTRRGKIDIRIITPGFNEISGTHSSLKDRFESHRRVIQALPVPFGSGAEHVDVFRIYLPQSTPAVICYLLRCPEVFDTFGKNSPETAIFFSRAVVEFVKVFHDFRVDLIHCNDWHTALIPVYLRTLYHHDPYVGEIPTLYTTHNAEYGYQGSFSHFDYLLRQAGLTGLDSESKASLNHFDEFNFCKAAIKWTTLVNTVSRHYQEEVLTTPFAGGLSSSFVERVEQLDSFSGIVNGIDTDEWNPENDPFIRPYNYSLSSGANRIAVDEVRRSKQKVRLLLRAWKDGQGNSPFQSIDSDSVLIGVVSRIDYQKTEILADAIDKVCNLEKVQVVVLGASERNDPHGNRLVDQISNTSKVNSGKLMFCNAFDIALSHLIYAASELFLVPSVFEPCGLTQLVAMRYGAVPIVRSIGGLVDTVSDETNPHPTGFRFCEPLPKTGTGDMRVNLKKAKEVFISCVNKAVNIHTIEPDKWNKLIINGMAMDSSWEKPGLKYRELYYETVGYRLVRS
jgi:starch synthase